MSFLNDMDKEITRITKEEERILKDASRELYEAVVEASPVAPINGGELKASWQMPEKESDRVYLIKDIAPHAIIIDGGRRMVGNKMQGSEQLPDGYTPIVQRVESQINRQLR